MKREPPSLSEATAEQTCFVYDVDTLDVVHIHQFCPLESGGRCPEDEMAATALKLASSDRARKGLAVLHHHGALDLSPGFRYRIDPDRKSFVAEPAGERPRKKRD
jgi:hypothetical protein